MTDAHAVSPTAQRKSLIRCCHPRTVALAIFIALLLFIWLCGYTRQPTGPASGEGAEGTLPQLPADKTVFRVATFNMHSGVGEDDVYNLSRTIEQVRDTDLCALQEVRGHYFGASKNQAQSLGQATQHAWLYAPTEYQYWHDEFGNGLLTRLPVETWVRIPLPIEPVHSGRRNCVIARVNFGGRIIPVLFAHIDRDKDQTNQLKFVGRLFESLQSPSLLLADLNAESKNPQVQAILAQPGVHDCIADSNADAQAHDRIDWIISRGFRTIKGGHTQNGASDHPIYWADVELSP